MTGGENSVALESSYDETVVGMPASNVVSSCPRSRSRREAMVDSGVGEPMALPVKVKPDADARAPNKRLTAAIRGQN